MNGATTAVWPGQPYPLGASWDGEGVNFALFSEHAERVELCLFDERGRRETARIPYGAINRTCSFKLPHDGSN
jgi:isoamylase